MSAKFVIVLAGAVIGALLGWFTITMGGATPLRVVLGAVIGAEVVKLVFEIADSAVANGRVSRAKTTKLNS